MRNLVGDQTPMYATHVANDHILDLPYLAGVQTQQAALGCHLLLHRDTDAANAKRQRTNILFTSGHDSGQSDLALNTVAVRFPSEKNSVFSPLQSWQTSGIGISYLDFQRLVRPAIGHLHVDFINGWIPRGQEVLTLCFRQDVEHFDDV